MSIARPTAALAAQLWFVAHESARLDCDDLRAPRDWSRDRIEAMFGNLSVPAQKAWFEYANMVAPVLEPQ
jgi:hypothetical protein